MSVKLTIMDQMAQVAREHGKTLAPLRDELALIDSGLDSLGIAVLVARGLSNKEVAERLVISKRTVDAHVNHIFGKIGLTSRLQLTIWLRDQAPGLLADELQEQIDARGSAEERSPDHQDG